MLPVAIALASEFGPMLLRRLVGDGAADVAEKVVSVAKELTGEASPDKALEALKANPDLALAYKTKLADVEIALETEYLKDRQNARARDTVFVEKGRYNYRADILAFLAVGGLIFCVWLIATNLGLPERAVNAIMFVAGVFASAVRDVFSFEFGSSRSSKDKDAVIAAKL